MDILNRIVELHHSNLELCCTSAAKYVNNTYTGEKQFHFKTRVRSNCHKAHGHGMVHEQTGEEIPVHKLVEIDFKIKCDITAIDNKQESVGHRGIMIGHILM